MFKAKRLLFMAAPEAPEAPDAPKAQDENAEPTAATKSPEQVQAEKAEIAAKEAKSTVEEAQKLEDLETQLDKNPDMAKIAASIKGTYGDRVKLGQLSDKAGEAKLTMSATGSSISYSVSEQPGGGYAVFKIDTSKPASEKYTNLSGSETVDMKKAIALMRNSMNEGVEHVDLADATYARKMDAAKQSLAAKGKAKKAGAELSTAMDNVDEVEVALLNRDAERARAATEASTEKVVDAASAVQTAIDEAKADELDVATTNEATALSKEDNLRELREGYNANLGNEDPTMASMVNQDIDQKLEAAVQKTDAAKAYKEGIADGSITPPLEDALTAYEREALENAEIEHILDENTQSRAEAALAATTDPVDNAADAYMKAEGAAGKASADFNSAKAVNREASDAAGISGSWMKPQATPDKDKEDEK